MDQIILIFIANVSIFLAIGLISYKHWLDLIRPDLFYIFNIYENDFFSYTQKKLFLPLEGKRSEYLINKCLYKIEECRPYINHKGVYEWNFKKGYSTPVYLMGDLNKLDGALLAEEKQINLDDIWSGSDSLIDFITKYGVIILIALLIIGYLLLRQQNMQATQLLLNATAKG